MVKKIYVYERKKFCVPVSKAEPLSSLKFIIDDFIQKKLTFCVDGYDDSWEIWRLEEETDSDKIKKNSPPIRPKYLFVNGIEVKEFDVI
jgi:hypothetical protein